MTSGEWGNAVSYVKKRPFVSKMGTSGGWRRLGYSASMPRPFALLFTLLLVVSRTSPASAQTFETAGARALGMGGAFVAVADDVTAIWWNPAGLATGGFFGLAVELHKFEQRRRSEERRVGKARGQWSSRAARKK